MTKILLLLTVLLAALANTATASNIHRRAGGGTRGAKPGLKAGKRKIEHSARQLSSHYEYIPKTKGIDPRAGGKGKGKMSKSSKGKYQGMMSRPECRPVVEGAEFIVEGAITSTMANMTESSGTIGTEFIYNGPLLEFNDDDDLSELENFFLSGQCIRTQESDGDMPGAGHCAYTITLDTGATVNFGGEAFDGWDNLMAINGGSQELIGISGTVTLIGLDDNFEDTADDFFSVPWIYGEAVLVYQICPQGYWDKYYIDNHDALPPPSIPDPFQRAVVEEPVVYEVVGDDDAGDDDGW